MAQEQQYLTTESTQIYRNLLGNNYNKTSDEELVLLVNRIKWFCHTIINSYLKEFSESKENKFLFLHSEKNG